MSPIEPTIREAGLKAGCLAERAQTQAGSRDDKESAKSANAGLTFDGMDGDKSEFGRGETSETGSQAKQPQQQKLQSQRPRFRGHCRASWGFLSFVLQKNAPMMVIFNTRRMAMHKEPTWEIRSRCNGQTRRLAVLTWMEFLFTGGVIIRST